MNSNYTMEMKYQVILNFLKSGGNKGFSQGEIARALMTDLRYASEDSARVSVGKLMADLQDRGLAYFVEEKPKRGHLPMKVWKLVENDGLREISGEE